MTGELSGKAKNFMACGWPRQNRLSRDLASHRARALAEESSVRTLREGRTRDEWPEKNERSLDMQEASDDR